VARCLIVACGCRGLMLARELRAAGHPVRATSRRRERLPLIAAAGAEARPADPNRVGTVVPVLADVALVYLLLGSACGTRDQLAALHGVRLQTLLQRMLDTTVRGILYEAAGCVPSELLEEGAATVRSVCEGSRIPFALLRADPQQPSVWVRAAVTAGERLLAYS
jgi:NADP-dependent 3-hydroxy acid dehydrogenase YdfG